jgi:predicted RNA-binding Zn ribbon-like protein
MTQVTKTVPEEEFPLYGGRACLNLVASHGKRHATPIERLPDPAAAARFLVAAGLVPARPAFSVTTRQRARLVELREAVYRLVNAARADRPLPAADRELLNRAALGAGFAPQLTGTRAGTGVSWTARRPLDAAIAELARDAVDLLGGEKVARIKECAHPDCSRLFLDESQAGRRRWCSMEKCGNLAKIAGYRGRTRG